MVYLKYGSLALLLILQGLAAPIHNVGNEQGVSPRAAFDNSVVSSTTSIVERTTPGKPSNPEDCPEGNGQGGPTANPSQNGGNANPSPVAPSNTKSNIPSNSSPNSQPSQPLNPSQNPSVPNASSNSPTVGQPNQHSGGQNGPQREGKPDGPGDDDPEVQAAHACLPFFRFWCHR